MGRRSRKRDGGSGGVQSAGPPEPSKQPPPRRRGPHRRPSIEDRPKPPWHPFPLVELLTLAGLVLLVLGFLSFESARGRVMLLCGLGLASLAGLETAVRDHFTGYRSHTILLSALPAVICAGVVFFARGPAVVGVGGGILVFALAFAPLRGAFRNRAGVSWRA